MRRSRPTSDRGFLPARLAALAAAVLLSMLGNAPASAASDVRPGSARACCVQMVGECCCCPAQQAATATAPAHVPGANSDVAVSTPNVPCSCRPNEPAAPASREQSQSRPAPSRVEACDRAAVENTSRLPVLTARPGSISALGGGSIVPVYLRNSRLLI